MAPADTVVHASCVSLSGRAVLIFGPSGSGKSALALQLMALGAKLIADDRTCLRTDNGTLIATSPTTIAGMIEARGIGLFTAAPNATAAQAKVVLAVDLSREETARLPEPHSYSVANVTLPCFRRVSGAHFAATILLYLSETLTQPT